MKWFKQIFSRRRFYGDLSEEIQGHLEEKVEELVGNGLSRKGAESAGGREFGNVILVKEKSGVVGRWSVLETLLSVVRSGVGVLLGTPGFSIVAIFRFALGVGANTAIFSGVY